MRKTEYNYIAGFDERLSQLMYENNVTAVQLGKIVNRERKTVSSWRNGGGLPNLVCLMKICAYFKVSADWLLFGEREI